MGVFTYKDLTEKSVILYYYYSGLLQDKIELIKVSSKLIPVDVDKLEK